MRTVVAAFGAALLLAGCFGGTDPNLTEEGEGRPIVSIDFPASVEARSEEVATLRVENPGPGDIEKLLVTFAALGAPDLPDALVGFGARGENPSIVDVQPKPQSVSLNGVGYVFDGIEEGGSITIEFTIRAPALPGRYANSVTAADGDSPERAKGVPLETQVEG